MSAGTLFIIDLMPLLYRGHFVFLRNPRLTSDGFNTSALIGLTGSLSAVLRREKPTHAVFAMDPGGPTFRHAAYPAYKQQREKMPEDLAASIAPALELAGALGIPVVTADGFEADDVMGTLAVLGAAAGFEVSLVTPDKDAAQLVRPGVRLYRPGRAGDEPEIYDEAGVCARWRLASPAQMVDFLALAGDASDNIPGIRGVGEKTAADLIARFGSVEGLLAGAQKLKGKLGERVALGKSDAQLSKMLATIRTDVPLTPDWEAYRLGEPDRARLSAFCAKYELNRFVRDVLGGEPSEGAAAPSKPAAEEPVALKTLADVPHDYRLVVTEDEARALLDELMRASRIAFDTETAESGGHASTEAHYARLVGFSFAVAPGKAWYVAGDLIDVFRPLFADAAKTFVGHNVKFDRSVLHRYGIGFRSAPRDTLLEHYCLDAAARHGLDALSAQYLGYQPIPIAKLIGERTRGGVQRSMADLRPEEVLDYAAEDADVALRLDDVLREKVVQAGAQEALETSEEPLVKVLADMERAGVRLDVAALAACGEAFAHEILELRQRILAYAEPGFNPDSPRQLGELLFGRLALPGGKRTPSGQYATDEKTLQKLVAAHPIVADVLEYRACAKLKSTYVDTLPRLIDEEGRVHTTYAQAFTETGRLSSSDPNLQNIPVRTERGRRIRRAFVARDAQHVLLSADYSQIELRLMAAFAQDEAMLAAFRAGADIHRDTASRVYGVAPEAVTPEMRAKCKMVNFGIIYGISAFGLAQRLNVPRKEAAELIETYFRLYPRVRAYMDEAIARARLNGYAVTVLGRRRTLRDISSRNATARQSAERDAINTPIQGSAADLIKRAMVRVAEALRAEGLRAKMVLQIHDELVFDVPKDEVGRLSAIVRREMTQAIDFGVPLEVDIGTGDNWLEAH